MAHSNFDSLVEQFRQTLWECQQLYFQAARQLAQQYPHLLPVPAHEFGPLMDDLHKGLVLKIYVSVMEADLKWSAEERRLAVILFEHIWQTTVPESQMRDAMAKVSMDSLSLQWGTLLEPFAKYPPLADRVGSLATVVMRLANLMAKCDGEVTPGETSQLTSIQAELDRLQRRNPLKNSSGVAGHATRAVQAAPPELATLDADDVSGPTVQERFQLPNSSSRTAAPTEVSPEQRLAAALQSLEKLIGLAEVKQEIKTLTNFLNMQAQRAKAGLPQTPLSLHMVFHGNPGTGKTTVARIIGEILGAMGIVKRGHVVETDRSGLVAEYAGQTGPKTNKRIDEALDGVLFIDEAYSLSATGDEDPFGEEVIQTLLKRMEDDRQRLVVILAGYPEPMERLLKSNPGLSSRFNTQFTFDDYAPSELGHIFQKMCEANHYQIPTAAQLQLMYGLKWLYDNRDEYFGNGRLVRNIFENSIRRLANRIASIAPITKEHLTHLHAADIDLSDVPEKILSESQKPDVKVRIACPGCRESSVARAVHLGQAVQCRKCGHSFTAAWGEPSDAATGST